jgi:outer membrane lipoprotein-sorting protein
MRAAALGLVVLLCVGCQGRIVAPWAVPARVERTFDTPGALLDVLAQRRSGLDTLKARARFTLRTPDHDVSADHAVVLRAGRALRLETLSPLGQPTGILVATGDRIRWVEPLSSRYWDGPMSSETIGRLTGLPLGLEEMVAILAGALPPVSGSSDVRLEKEPGADAYRLHIREEAPAGRQVAVVARRDLTVRTRNRYDAAGREVLRVKNDRFRAIGGYPFPLREEVSLPHRELSLTVEYQWVRLNQGVSDELFDLPIPPGARRIEWE